MLVYTLPGVKDNEGDNITIKVEMGSAKKFVRYAGGSIIVDSKSLSDIGKYDIVITLKDDNNYPMYNTYILKVEVKPDKDYSIKSTPIIIEPSNSLTANIKSIDAGGLLTINFNKDVKLPDNLNEIN